MSDNSSELRRLPQVDQLASKIGSEEPRAIAAEAARAAIDEARAAVLSGSRAPSEAELLERARLLLRAAGRKRLTRVINATGVLLHTNLGRAPLGEEALAAMHRLGAGYSNLEYDLEKGTRGSRYSHAASLLSTLTGAEAALVVNNNAAAVLLTVDVLARGREVIISRGELIEIGGGFRIPEILSTSGALLKEVGTTNRTHLADYERALSDKTAAIMKVHPSNYRVTGFASAVEAAELARIAHDNGLPFVYDLGSGLLRSRVSGIAPNWLVDEPTVEQALGDGADVITFSGDKLLGGPQAGILLGREDLIRRMHASPLLRAFRVDKTTLAALEATLLACIEGREAVLPVWRMALAGVSEIEDRVAVLRSSLEASAAKVQTIDGFSTTGGGSLPDGAIPTVLLEISPRAMSPNELIRRLLDADVPVVARIEEDRVVVDLRTVDEADDPYLGEVLRRVLASHAGGSGTRSS
jgi:L-seryl-tRNA(Ser) seleniumtransferase